MWPSWTLKNGQDATFDVCCCLVAKSCPTLCDPMDCSSPDSSVHTGQNTGVGCHCLSPRDLPNPGIEPGSPVLAGELLTTEPPGKPKFDVIST